MLDLSIYILYRAASAFFSLFPLRLLFRIGEFLGLFGWLLSRKYRRLARHNLTVAFGGEKSALEIAKLARRHFQRLGANLLCSVKLASMPLDRVRALVQTENAESINRELRNKKPVVLILSHLGNWELFALILPGIVDYARNSTVYQKLRNPYIEAHVRRMRGRAGVELFERSEGFAAPIQLLRDAGGVAVLGDQHAGDHGIWTPFFGRLASTTSLPALLAKRTGAAIMAAAMYTDGPGRWRLVFTERFDERGDSIEALTAKMNEAIAGQIRRAPEDWFWVHNRWKTPKPHFLLSQYRRGVYLPAATPARDLKPFRILVRGSNWLGDSVISAPAIRAIKRGRPDAHITVAAPAKIAAVWKLVREVDEVVSLTSGSLLQAVRTIRRQQPFDVAVLLPNSLRAALEVFLAGVPRRVGFRGHNRARLLNQIVPESKKPAPIRHQVERYLDFARKVGANVEETESADANFPVANNGQITIGLCPGAEYGPAKRWLPERFAETALAVSARVPVRWKIFGTAADSELAATIAGKLGDICEDRAGKTSLDELVAELRHCRALLTNDTGTMHLAALLGIPVIAIFGSTEPRLTGPLGNGHRILRRHVECSPCFLRECPIDFRCMHAVSVEEVAQKILDELLTENVRHSRSS